MNIAIVITSLLFLINTGTVLGGTPVVDLGSFKKIDLNSKSVMLAKKIVQPCKINEGDYKGRFSADCIKKIVDIELEMMGYPDEVPTRGVSAKYMAGISKLTFYVQITHALSIKNKCKTQKCIEENAYKVCTGNTDCISDVKYMVSVFNKPETDD